ncbi:hypothetical protein EBO15_19785 [Actinomadura harenae]|uniref:DinB family protein n=2 Tax=Actinomadura harenae TaxID=2483351 RepID=A0A3M2LYW2_9ACTN|nr:hypothetical protein EBO15_19785 [Actinomadura harenae]
MEKWGANLYGDPCRACGFDWGLTPDQAVTLVRTVPAQFEERLQNATGRERHAELDWTPSAYVSHVADNLRTWAERLKGACANGVTEIPSYDPDLLAAARRYEDIALAAALWSLTWSSRAWTEAVEEAMATDIVLQHATRGPQKATDVARNNAHDAHHHLHDVDRILNAQTPTPK